VLTTFPSITSTRTSFPFDSRMNRWSMMSSPRLQIVSSIDSTDAWLSAKITPVPCVPFSSFMISGVPPTSPISRSSRRGYRDISVSGTRTPRDSSSCRHPNLFRDRPIAVWSFTHGIPITRNCRTTAIE
jgi:hypothetical protein